MTHVETAKAIARPIGDMGGAFMMDGATYARGAELGFSGIDFYVLGRGGVLGDTMGTCSQSDGSSHSRWRVGCPLPRLWRYTSP